MQYLHELYPNTASTFENDNFIKKSIHIRLKLYAAMSNNNMSSGIRASFYGYGRQQLPTFDSVHHNNPHASDSFVGVGF
jgi:hypothetical protein